MHPTAARTDLLATTAAPPAGLDLVEPPEAAEILLVSPWTLAKWRCKPGGPPFVKCGKRIGYPRALLLAWRDARLQRSTADRPQVAA